MDFSPLSSQFADICHCVGVSLTFGIIKPCVIYVVDEAS